MPDDKLAKADYEELERIFDVIEPLLLSLAGEQQLLGATVERWRWDEPAITLTWTDRQPGKISRNVRFLGVPEAPYRVIIEMNAWLDEDLDDTGRRQRKWAHDSWDKLPLAKSAADVRLDVGSVKALLQDACHTVSGWRESDLQLTHRLVA